MSQAIHAPVSLPEWFKLANPRAMFGTREVAELLGITQEAVHRLKAKGVLPEPVKMARVFSPGHRHNDYSLRWSKAQLVIELRKMQMQAAGASKLH